MNVLVTGGTGTLGRLVVPRLVDAGRSVRVLSRRPRESGARLEHLVGDLLRDEGLGPALDGVDTVVHLAGGPRGDDVATRHLLRAALTAKVRHLVLISIIGADRLPVGYYRRKAASERAVAGSDVPWTTLRTAQFHDLALSVVSRLALLPVVPVPRGVRLEPVDVRDVAERITELALGQPAGAVPDLAGPAVHDLGTLAHAYLRASGRRRRLASFPLPRRVGGVYLAGENLASPGADRGQRTWEDFLAERLGSAAR